MNKVTDVKSYYNHVPNPIMSQRQLACKMSDVVLFQFCKLRQGTVLQSDSTSPT